MRRRRDCLLVLSLRRDLSTGKQCAVKLFKRPVDADVAHQLVQGINIQCGANLDSPLSGPASGSAAHEAKLLALHSLLSLDPSAALQGGTG